MNGLESLALSTGASIAGQAANQIGYGLGKLTGYNKSIADDQYNQQKRLTELQGAMNLGLMKQSYAEQLNLWNQTNAEAQIAHYKAAGLNPALMYAKGGGSGTTGGGGTSVSGTSASGESERMQANNAATGMGLQLQKIASEIKLNDSIAKKNEAEANLTSGAETGLKEAQTTQISEIIKNLSADTELKGEQSKLAELQQNSLKIQNEFNTSNNETLLKQNIEILKELTAKANVAESTQTDLINLS